MRVVVVGANHKLGRTLVAALRDAGHEVVGTSRSPVTDASGLDFVVADALDQRSLEAALRHADLVVDNVSAFRAGGFPRAQYARIASEAHVNIISAARACGVGKAVLVSTLGTDVESVSTVPHFLEKARAERAYKASALRTLIVRPGMFVDQEDRRLEKGFDKGVYEAIGRGAPFSWVHMSSACATIVDGIAQDAFGEVRDAVDGTGTPDDFARAMSEHLRRPIAAKLLPLWAFSAATFAPSLCVPGVRNLRAMMRFMDEGHLVARAK
mmetsp:Transcript_3895/g.12050  ORF Transcript_3895/g.12050 Transcript_3895/m.12050 type:complete len:268 (-) Transcript_3895:84-887(-)